MAYLYKHIRLDTNEVFYIGIGYNNNFKRAFSKCNRNKYWKNIVNKTNYSVEIVESNISWNDACKLEISLIKIFGRKDLNKGCLVNMTNGGDGIVGLIQTDEHKRKNSEANKGKKKTVEQVENFKNRHQSDETKLKISISNKGRKCSNETKEKISNKLKNKYVGDKNFFYGKKHTNETKKIIGDNSRGRILTQETKNKISLSNLEKTHIVTEETKHKMSVSSKLRNVIPPSRKGTCWIKKDNGCKSIKVNELQSHILLGWTKGRIINK